MTATIRIGLLDTDYDVRFGRRLVLSSEPEFEVVFDSAGSTDDLEAIEQSLIDVLVLDQRLASGPGVSFYASLRKLVGLRQTPPAVLTTSFAQPDLLLNALQEGIYDVVSVDQGAQALVAALSRATSGVTAYSLSAIWELVTSQPTQRAVDLSFVRLVDELPQKLSTRVKKLKSVWHSSDLVTLEKFDIDSLNALVQHLPVSSSVELVVAMNRSGLLDGE